MFEKRFIPYFLAVYSFSFKLGLGLHRTLEGEEYEQVEEARKELQTKGNYASTPVLFPEFKDMMESKNYEDFIEYLDENIIEEVVAEINFMLRSRYVEHRLDTLKNSSIKGYVARLREINEEELVDAIINGHIVNTLQFDGTYEAIRSDENYSGLIRDEGRPATAKLDVTVLQSVLSQFSNRKNSDLHPNPQGLRMRQVVITGGGLNLNWLKTDFPIGFEWCDFHSWISMDHAEVPWLNFEGCDFTAWDNFMGTSGAFNAANATFGKLEIRRFKGLNQIFLLDSHLDNFHASREEAEDREPEDNAKNSDDLKSANRAGTDMRLVVSNASFKELYVTDSDFTLDFTRNRSLEVGKLTLSSDVDLRVKRNVKKEARRVYKFVAGYDPRNRKERNAKKGTQDLWMPQDVSDTLEKALKAGGNSEIAREFGILAAHERVKSKGFRGWFQRFTLGSTVQYFYNNIRAVWWLLGVFMLTWVVTLLMVLPTPDLFMKQTFGGIAAVPRGWFGTIVEKILWSLMYSMDTVFSPLSLGQADSILPQSLWIVFFYAIMKIIGLLLLGIIIIGISGLAEVKARN